VAPSVEPRLTDALASAGWTAVCDQLLSALAADLEGRVASLGGLLQLVEMDPRRSSVGDFVTAEIDRLREAVSLLGLLGHARPRSEPVAIEPGLHMPRLLDLLALVKELDGVRYLLDVDTGAAALAPAGLHARLQLCALSAAGWEARARDRRVEVEVRDAAAGVLTRMIVPGELDESVDRGAAAACPGGVEELAAALGGESSWVTTPECARLEVRLPTAP